MSSFTIVHAADLHLDRAFTESGLRQRAAERRRSLLDALIRITELARERAAGALCIAGDLYEHEHVTADTEQTLVRRFKEFGRPVLLLPGNHDPFLPGSLYERASWPDNVHVFTEPEPRQCELAPDLVVWGIAYTGRELRPEALRGFRVPSDGRRHLLLLHASLRGEGMPFKGDALPLNIAELEATGAEFAMLGHYHGGFVAAGGRACYPGSPEPLSWGETGTHAACVLRIEAGGPRPELVPVNSFSVEHAVLDLTGAASADEVEQALRARIERALAEFVAERPEARLALRVELTGEVAPSCELDAGLLARSCGEQLAELAVENRTLPAFDLEAIAKERTTRGRFVAKLLERAERQPAERERAMAAARAGLRAIEKRGQLLDLSAPDANEGTGAG